MPDELVSQKLEKLVLSKLSSDIYTLTDQIVGGFIEVFAILKNLINVAYQISVYGKCLWKNKRPDPLIWIFRVFRDPST